jgi:hypothetical protein
MSVEFWLLRQETYHVLAPLLSRIIGHQVATTTASCSFPETLIDKKGACTQTTTYATSNSLPLVVRSLSLNASTGFSWYSRHKDYEGGQLD